MPVLSEDARPGRTACAIKSKSRENGVHGPRSTVPLNRGFVESTRWPGFYKLIG